MMHAQKNIKLLRHMSTTSALLSRRITSHFSCILPFADYSLGLR